MANQIAVERAGKIVTVEIHFECSDEYEAIALADSICADAADGNVMLDFETRPAASPGKRAEGE